MDNFQGIPSLPVSVKGFTWSAAAGWSTFLLVASALGVWLKAIGPARLYEIWSNRDKDLRVQKRTQDMADHDRLVVAEQRAASAEGKLVYVSSALTLLIGVLESISPEHPALKQARDLVAMAASTDDAYGIYLKQLATVARTEPQ